MKFKEWKHSNILQQIPVTPVHVNELHGLSWEYCTKIDNDRFIVKKKIRVEVHCKTKELSSVVSKLNKNT